MKKRNESSMLRAQDLVTEDGYPSPKLITEAYKSWGKKFKNIQIVSRGLSVCDILKDYETHPEQPLQDKHRTDSNDKHDI